MKRFAIFIAALAMAGTAAAGQSTVRKIRIECSPSLTPLMIDVRRAIARSDYGASLSARREILARAQSVCSARADAVLTFVPPAAEDNDELAQK